MTKATKLILPSNLSFRRSVDVSEGGLFSVLQIDGDEVLRPVEVVQTTVRGAMAAFTSGYVKGGQPLTGDALARAQNPASPNIQTIDRATLDPASDMLSLRFSMAFHGGGRKPDACSDPVYAKTLSAFHDAASAAGLHVELAARYLWNVVNGRALWRNACGIPATVAVTDATHGGSGERIVFNWGDIPADAFPGLAAMSASEITSDGGLVEEVVHRIAAALRGSAIIALDVDIRVRLYKGAEVWPSQEFAEKSQKVRDGREISRILSSRPIVEGDRRVRQGTMHSQKLGNAIRTIDEWHGSQGYGAVPVEAYGWVQRDLVAIRKPSDRKDGYSAFSDLAATTAALEAGRSEPVTGAIREKALYTLAMILRGGVYGIGKGDTKAEADGVVAEADTIEAA